MKVWNTIKHTHVLPILLLVCAAILGCRSLLHPGFYTSHDGEHQIVRLMHFHQGLMDGQLPVRWAGTALEGDGYPLFIFTYRLPFWVAEVYYLLFHNLSGAIKFAFIVSFLLSGLSMYWFLHAVFKKKMVALLGAFMYLWAPYRFLDIFVRAALGEAFTFVFFPLIMLALYKLSQKTRQYWWILLLSFGVSGLLLSHVMTLMVVAIPLFLWMLLQLVQSDKKLAYIRAVVISSGLSALATTYYWLPAFSERSYTKFSSVLSTYYKDHFVTLKQLLYSRWLYGFSMPGTQDDMMSFQVGIGQWLVIGIFLSGILLIKLWPKLVYTVLSPVPLLNYRIALYTLASTVIAVFMMLPFSNPVYRLTNQIMVIDIPWKFLTVTTLVIPLLFSTLLNSIRNRYVFGLFVLGVSSVLVYGNRNHLNVNEYVYKAESEYWQSTHTSNEHSEYAPMSYIQFRDNKRDELRVELPNTDRVFITNKDRGDNRFSFVANVSSPDAWIVSAIPKRPGWWLHVDGKPQPVLENQGNIAFYLQKGIHTIDLKFKDAQLISYLGDSENTLQKRTSKLFFFTSDVSSDKVQVFTKVANYPGWKLYVDNKPQFIKTFDGRIIVDLPKGLHQVRLGFENTPLRATANILSLLTIILVGVYSAYVIRRDKLKQA